MSQLIFGETSEEKGEEDGVVALADKEGSTIDYPEREAGAGRTTSRLLWRRWSVRWL
jgi:hypothetical protein